MSILLRFAIVYLFLFGGVGVLYSEDLLYVVKEALKNNYTYKSAIEQFNADYAYKGLAKSYLLPKFDVSLEYTENNQLKDYSSSNSSDYDFSSQSSGITISLKQPLFDMAAFAEYSKAKLLAQRAQIDLDKQRNDMMLKATTYYFDVLAAQDNLDYINADLDYLQRYIREIQKKIEVGEVRASDIEDVKASYSSAEYEKLLAQNDLQVKKDLLNKFINGNLVTYNKVSNNIVDNVSIAEINVDTWVSKAHSQNLEVLYYQISLLLAEEDVKVIQSGYYPNLSLVGGYSQFKGNDGLSNFTDDDYDDTQTYVGLQLNINIYEGGATKTKREQSLFQKRSLDYQLSELYNTTSNTTIQYYLNVYNGISQIDALKQSVISAQKSLDAADAGYKVGTKTTTDVLIATENLFDTERSLSQAKYNFLLSILALKSITGILKELDIVEINNYLE